MGLLNAIQGNSVYLDTNIWIYALEGFPAFVQELSALFQASDGGTLTAVTSEPSLAEVLVKPFQNRDVKQQETFKQAIANTQTLAVAPVSREILIIAAQLRATTNVKLPDSNSRPHATVSVSTPKFQAANSSLNSRMTIKRNRAK